ncbi:restriction endonuclease subunit S [Staphylococcus kloosii]|uniref:restriction endonuclease subunit S n=1 Tax=Staphylococcus kloosii TaxID=29384 RepID=UPI000D1F39C0|nr:restriction endonuclease subunit S [Staphylococcus kloosii]PTJ74839.1 restriction endonuclease subunit S [Staphylococcus kloosii]
MTNEVKNVPELRFPEFEDEWENSTIGDLGKFNYGKSAPKWSITENATTPCIRYGELYTKFNGIIKEIFSFTNIDTEKLYFSKGEEVLVPRVGEDPMDFSKCAYLPFPNVAIGEMISVYNTEQNSLFITYYFISKMKYEFAKRVEGGSVSNLYYSYLEDIRLSVPTIKEQQKIGDFFSKLDCQIELEEQKLEKLEQQKKGYMQKIFTQQLRFKDDNQKDYPKWNETTIKEIASISTGNKDTKDAIENGKYEFYVRSPKIHKINSYSFDGEAVLTVGDGVGVGKVFHYVNGKFDYHQRVYKISDFNNYDAILFYYYFSTHFLREAQKYNAKTSVDSVRKDMISNMKIPDLIIEEQEKISHFLSNLDELINKYSRKIERLKLRRKGFLQKMFV